MRLDELLNNPLPWTETDVSDDYVEYMFSVEDLGMYMVSFSDVGADDGTWELSFALYDNDQGRAQNTIVGTGGKELQVFATVKDILQDFMQSHSSGVEYIEFSSKEPSRTKLYRRLARMLGHAEETYHSEGGFTQFRVKI